MAIKHRKQFPSKMRKAYWSAYVQDLAIMQHCTNPNPTFEPVWRNLSYHKCPMSRDEALIVFYQTLIKLATAKRDARLGFGDPMEKDGHPLVASVLISAPYDPETLDPKRIHKAYQKGIDALANKSNPILLDNSKPYSRKVFQDPSNPKVDASEQRPSKKSLYITSLCKLFDKVALPDILDILDTFKDIARDGSFYFDR